MSGFSLGRWRQRWLIAPVIVANVPSTLAQGQFERFFQGWDSVIKESLNGNCSEQMKNYTQDPNGKPKWAVVDCILSGFSEMRKADGAAAALTFGLAPAVLKDIGPSTDEISLLFMRRPLLALLLAISSPWLRNPDGKIYEKIYVGEISTLTIPPVDQSEDQPYKRSIWPDEESKGMAMMVSFVEYALALGAAANVALLSHQLGHWAFFSSANNTYDPVLWTYCSLLIHAVGIFACFQRFRECDIVMSWSQRWLFNEFRLAAHNTPLRLRKPRKYSSALHLFLRWILSIAPSLQVIMGTIMLSGSLLTAQGDARTCLFRYIASTFVAQVLLQYELWCLTRKSHDARGELGSPKKTETELTDYSLVRQLS